MCLFGHIVNCSIVGLKFSCGKKLRRAPAVSHFAPQNGMFCLCHKVPTESDWHCHWDIVSWIQRALCLVIQGSGNPTNAKCAALTNSKG